MPALLEIDGVDLHPHTVDPRVAADLIQTFFELVARAAVVRGVALQLRGITIRDKCFCVQSETEAPDLTIAAMEIASDWMSGAEEPDADTDRKLARHFKAVAKKMGEKAHAKSRSGDGPASLSSPKTFHPSPRRSPRSCA